MGIYRFSCESGFLRRKSATKLLYVKTFSGRAVVHSLSCLTVYKW